MVDACPGSVPLGELGCGLSVMAVGAERLPRRRVPEPLAPIPMPVTVAVIDGDCGNNPSGFLAPATERVRLQKPTARPLPVRRMIQPRPLCTAGLQISQRCVAGGKIDLRDASTKAECLHVSLPYLGAVASGPEATLAYRRKRGSSFFKGLDRQ
jgi:hypothetical protein